MRNNTYCGKLLIKEFTAFGNGYKIARGVRNNNARRCEVPRDIRHANVLATCLFSIYIYIIFSCIIYIFIFMYSLTYVLISTRYLANSLSYVKKLSARKVCSQTRGSVPAFDVSTGAMIYNSVRWKHSRC